MLPRPWLALTEVWEQIYNTLIVSHHIPSHQHVLESLRDQPAAIQNKPLSEERPTPRGGVVGWSVEVESMPTIVAQACVSIDEGRYKALS